MAGNVEVKAKNGQVSEQTLRKSIEFQRIGNAAIHKAQEENRRLGIPNWYSVGGKIISDTGEVFAKDEENQSKK